MSRYERSANAALVKYFGQENKSLKDVYKVPSMAKRIAWKNIERICSDLKGYGLSIISKNQQMFTCGFMYRDEKQKLRFYYFTPNYDISIEI